MKELIFKTGGRPLFNTDFEVLQNLTKSFESQYADEAPFIISGMVFTLVTGDTYNISAGYVWLGGRIRKFDGTNNLDLSTDKFLNVRDVDENREYQDKVTRVSATDYGVIVASTQIGGTSSLRLSKTATSVRRYVKDVLGSKALMLSPATSQQTVTGTTALEKLKFTGSTQIISSINTSSTSIPDSHNSISTSKVLREVKAALEAKIAADVAGLIDSSPAALNTLNELAAALGDDPNFATTMNNALAQRINYSDIINALTSTATNKPLSAAQGKALNDSKLNKSGGTITGGLTVQGGISTGDAILKTKIIEIGAWNMDSSVTKDVTHGLPDKTKIHVDSVSIQDDDGNTIYPLNSANQTGQLYGAVWLITDTFIRLARTDAQNFDYAGAFGSTAVNRGWIKITYEV